jgi:hypothetical protein
MTSTALDVARALLRRAGHWLNLGTLHCLSAWPSRGCHPVWSDPGFTGAFRLESQPEFLSALPLPAFFLAWESFRCHGAGRDRACVHPRAGLAFRHADPGVRER